MTILISCITTTGLMLILKYSIGLTVENAEKGIDYITHGRQGYVSESDKARIFAEMVEPTQVEKSDNENESEMKTISSPEPHV